MSTTQSELRLASLLDERETVTKLHDTVLASVATNDDKLPTDSQSQMIKGYREKEIALDEEISDLTDDIERNRRAVENSKAVRRVLAGSSSDGVEQDGDGVAYRTMAAYARDVILTSEGRELSKIAAQLGDRNEIVAARERLQLAKRTPANTLSSDVGGLQPAQHIEEIFQVIQTARPIVASAHQAALNRGQLTYPQVSQRPLVAVQNTEKTEGGNQAMHVDLETATASTYLGGGDLSWQAINWSTPDALQLWFNLAADSYALLTEQDAAQVITDSGQTHVLGTTFNAASGSFANLLTAIGAGASAVYANSGRTADTVYMAVDAYWYIFGLTSTAFAQFASVNDGRVGPLNFIPSRGLDSATVIVGDSQALLCAETPGAPVELRVVEPAIGGVEVGLIGAFEAVVVDPGAFCLISAAS